MKFVLNPSKICTTQFTHPTFSKISTFSRFITEKDQNYPSINTKYRNIYSLFYFEYVDIRIASKLSCVCLDFCGTIVLTYWGVIPNITVKIVSKSSKDNSNRTIIVVTKLIVRYQQHTLYNFISEVWIPLPILYLVSRPQQAEKPLHV